MDEKDPQPAAGLRSMVAGRRGVLVAAVVAGLLICGGGAFAVTRVISFGGGDSAAAPWVSASGASAGASSAPAVTATGPRAGDHPVRGADDLALVCDGTFYPKAPRFAGKAPHQITVGVVDSTGRPNRHVLSSIDVPDLKNWRAWTPASPAKTQLVGCVDLVSAGETVRSCKFDDPQPKTVALRRATYRVRLFEATTGRKLLDRPAVEAGDQNCPSVVLLVGGESLVSAVSDKQLYDLFRPYVMRN